MYTPPPPLSLPALGTTPPTSKPFWRIVETRWCSATLTPTMPRGSQEQETTEHRPEGRPLTGQSTVRNLLLQTKISLPDSPPRASLSRRISPFWAGISLMWHGPPLGQTISFSSHTPPRKADWEGFTAETERNSPTHLYQPPTLLGKKSLQAYSRRRWKTHNLW